jgi:hypothetical protein
MSRPSNDPATIESFMRTNLIAWGVVAMIICVVPAVMLFGVVPSFESLFKGLGADLPWNTQLLISHTWLLLVPPVAAVILVLVTVFPAAGSVARQKKVIIALAVFSCLAIVVGSLAIEALYAPIFKLGAVV